MAIHKSSTTDIFRNLAKEEYLLGTQSLACPVLMLWQSRSAVVIGKHQNPWQECLVDKLKEKEIPLVRRISGGGTVYHDMGNLNYAVISEVSDYDSGKIYEMIFNALQSFNLNGKLEKKSNLCIDHKKFSGNAFTFRKNRVLHHGTLLVNTDLAKLRYWLQPQYPDISSRAIASIPASIVNLQDLNPKINIQTLSSAIEESFISMLAQLQKEELDDNFFNAEQCSEIQERLRSKAWILGKTPSFSISFNGQTRKIENGNWDS